MQSNLMSVLKSRVVHLKQIHRRDPQYKEHVIGENLIKTKKVIMPAHVWIYILCIGIIGIL